ncbi:hypothetical protein ACH5RR_005644 [Cinchona calisaya]|uniref:Mitochondrial fission protein ELM1 n=1 Tax=Cinchona calisaya TaxID=153742 RepID=A0ABD3ALS2_9GENT
MRTAIRRAIVIGNGIAGAENQSIGLIRALGLPHTLYRVTRPSGGIINNGLRWLPLSLHKKLHDVIKGILVGPPPVECQGFSGIVEAEAHFIAKLALETFDKDGPTLVVASGWDTISVASSIKRLAPENVFVVQIQHPRSKLNRFDLVITPRHDYYPLTPEGQQQIPWFLRRWITPREPPDRKVVLTVGSLHQADSTALQTAASFWHHEFAALPKPLLVVNIGGPTSHCRYGVDLAKQLTASLLQVLSTCGSLRISFSRRTPKQVSDILVRELGHYPKVYIWNGEDPNLHMGHLAWGDAFVITADSVSMLSEACSTGKPVYVIGAERCGWKFADFHKSLRDRGVVRPFTGEENMSQRWKYTPLSDTEEAAGQVIKALAERGWRLQS